MSTDITLFNKDTFDQAVKIAQTLAKSKMVPVSIQGKPEDIFAILVMGSELGLSPMQSLQSIDNIQGKPTVKPQLMMGMVRGKLPGSIIDIKQDPSSVKVTVRTSRSKEDLADGLYYETTWDMLRADKMGLSMKDNYKKQPLTMLTWRAVAEACRMTFPDIVMGLYVPEEFQNFDGEVINGEVVTKAENKSMMDQDFPIPPEEREVGDLYRIQHGKWRSMQLKDIDPEDMAEYREELIKRKTKKEWETDLISVFSQYLGALNGKEDVIEVAE
jgi:hypothetical protein